MPVGGWVDHAVMGHHPMDISSRAREPEKEEEHAGEQGAAPANDAESEVRNAPTA